VNALRLLQERQAKSRVKAGEFWEDWGLVFSTEVGTPIHPRNDYRDFQMLVERAGLRRVRLHDLRHTAASLMLAQGVPARVVMEVLGHSQISITLNTYTHVSAGLSREAADRMQLLLGGTSEVVAAGLAARTALSAGEGDDAEIESAAD
jgi:integrase